MSALVQQLQQQQQSHNSQIALLRAAMPAKSSSEGGERKQVQVVVQNSTRQKQPMEMPNYDPARLKKHGKNGQPPPVSVARRNARERNRVKQVNHGFATLREHIPNHVSQSYGDRGKKLSKVETLRMAVEYIRALQRLLSEADGQDPDSFYDTTELHQHHSPSGTTIPSPTGSGFSGSDGLQVSGIAGDELHGCTDESEQPDSSGFLDDELEDSKEGVLADSKRFLEQQQHQTRSLTEQNRLTENQNRTEPRRRRDSPISSYYTAKQLTFGDEENIEPLSNRHNNNSLTATNNNTTPSSTTTNNNNILLSSFPPLLLQASPTAVLPPVKRELQLIQQQQEIDSCGTREEEVMLDSSSPYSAQMLIEGVQEARLEPGAQIVYVTTTAEGTAAYYRHELPNAEFMDTWWEQDRQQRIGHV